MKRLLVALAIIGPTSCSPSHAAPPTAAEIAQVAVKALSCAEITPHATRALRYVMEGQPYELYYATTLAQPGINAYQRWVLEGLYLGLEQQELTLGDIVGFTEVWTTYCITTIGHGKLELTENRQFRGE